MSDSWILATSWSDGFARLESWHSC
jgi:hypothetical protein